jgi:hypothetical protein
MDGKRFFVGGASSFGFEAQSSMLCSLADFRCEWAQSDREAFALWGTKWGLCSSSGASTNQTGVTSLH